MILKIWLTASFFQSFDSNCGFGLMIQQRRNGMEWNNMDNTMTMMVTGESVSIQMLDGNETILQGPATITMVSQHTFPPIPYPVQVSFHVHSVCCVIQFNNIRRISLPLLHFILLWEQSIRQTCYQHQQLIDIFHNQLHWGKENMYTCIYVFISQDCRSMKT